MTKYEVFGLVGVCILLVLNIVVSSNPINYVANDNLSVVVVSPLESNGAIPVNIQDQTTPPFDLYFIQSQAVPTTLLVNASIDDLTINLSSTVGFVDGSYVGIFCPDENRFYFGTQIGSPIGNSITLDTPLDFNFTTGDNVLGFSRDLNVDGSNTTQIFEIQGTGGNAEIDITRILIQMTTDTDPQFSDFGDITDGLDNGIVLRRVNGDIRNIWNIKSNSEFANHAFDYTPYVASNPGQGVPGIAVRYSFAGQSKHGVAVRLAQGESLELWIQDDLSSLASFRIIAEGHLVTD